MTKNAFIHVNFNKERNHLQQTFCTVKRNRRYIVIYSHHHHHSIATGLAINDEHFRFFPFFFCYYCCGGGGEGTYKRIMQTELINTFFLEQFVDECTIDCRTKLQNEM